MCCERCKLEIVVQDGYSRSASRNEWLTGYPSHEPSDQQQLPVGISNERNFYANFHQTAAELPTEQAMNGAQRQNNRNLDEQQQSPLQQQEQQQQQPHNANLGTFIFTLVSHKT